MNGSDPLDLIARVADMFDDLDVPYVLDGSLAATFFGEPRSTMDIDVAVVVGPALGEALLTQAAKNFYLPTESARRALQTGDSFNLLSLGGGTKVDIFVLGDGLLDQRQIQRRVQVRLPGSGRSMWVTAPEDQVLRKLTWLQSGGFSIGSPVARRSWDPAR